VLKSQCEYKVDLVCGIQERSGEWKIFSKNAMSPQDTLYAYGCDGSGKLQYWFRFAGDTSHLPTYDELNPGLAKKQPIDLFARLLYGNKKKPLKGQRVELLNSKGETVQCSVTDNHGDFTFHKLSNSERYEVFVGDVDLPKDEKLYIAKQNGFILSELRWVKERNYKYSFLPVDIVTLSEIEVLYPALATDIFIKKEVDTLKFTEQILYKSGSVVPSNFNDLDKILGMMKKNSTYSLLIISHTDSYGDDAKNLKLSEERSSYVKSYFVKKGIAATRLEAIGKGEAQILNHCVNGSKCSDAEHSVNRRTEFVFKKSAN
jgi:outer membrane protein OmpA-like peptidoglycan-associated protein